MKTTNGEDGSSPQAADASSEEYFQHNPRPSLLNEYTHRARQFIQRHTHETRPIVLVTSGGTTVPLENQTVRFIDNFSAGTRGATSAEYFLKNGYAVVFLHRQYSLLPYSRHYSHSTNCFLDFMQEEHDTVQGDEAVEGGGLGKVVVAQEFQAKMVKVLRDYHKAKSDDTLLLLHFTTINEYLWLLRSLAELMKPVGERALFYLAAAVSDFFVPSDRMVEHKIQSGEEFHHINANDEVDDKGLPAAHMRGQSLIIDLDPVPKFLKRLVDGWAPSAMIVSFKLETDASILTTKARHALTKYAHHLVIGNLLKTRKYEVVFVTKDREEHWIRIPHIDLKPSTSKMGTDTIGEHLHKQEHPFPLEIESLIIPEVKKLHETFMSQKHDSGTNM